MSRSSGYCRRDPLLGPGLIAAAHILAVSTLHFHVPTSMAVARPCYDWLFPIDGLSVGKRLCRGMFSGPMRYLVISDIHANAEALEAVLDAEEEWDSVLCLGDLVGYGPNPNEVVQRVQGLPNLTCIIGNHDVAALGHIDLDTFNPHAKFAALWTQRQMTEGTRSFLEGLGQVEEMDGFTAAHGSPRDPVWEYLDRLTQAPENFARFTTPICFVGHTHVPRVFTQEPDSLQYDTYIPGEDEVIARNSLRRIVNPGSVGQPRDGDPRASFGLFETDPPQFSYRRLPYDIQSTQAKMDAAGLPKPLSDRLAYGF